MATEQRNEGGQTAPSRAMVVHPASRSSNAGRHPDARLAEAIGLAQAIDLQVITAEIVPVSKLRSATLIGLGAVERLAGVVPG